MCAVSVYLCDSALVWVSLVAYSEWEPAGMCGDRCSFGKEVGVCVRT